MDVPSQQDLENVNRILLAKSPYEVLGINLDFMKNPDAKENLKKVYRKLSLKIHPDKNHSPNSAKAFQILSSSYDYLTQKSQKNPFPEPKKPPSSPFPFYFYTTSKFSSAKHDDYLCKATTKNGSRCQNYASNPFDGKFYCHVHVKFDPSKVKKKAEGVKSKCQAKCKDDTLCSKSAKEGSKYCGIHANYNPDLQKPKEVPKEKIKCGANTKAGNPCAKYAQTGSKFCGIHKDYK